MRPAPELWCDTVRLLSGRPEVDVWLGDTTTFYRTQDGQGHVVIETGLNDYETLKRILHEAAHARYHWYKLEPVPVGSRWVKSSEPHAAEHPHPVVRMRARKMEDEVSRQVREWLADIPKTVTLEGALLYLMMREVNHQLKHIRRELRSIRLRM